MVNLDKKRLRSNIWKFYIFQILLNLTFFVPVCVLFWQENGLTMTEIMILQSIFSIAVMLLEIPTGYFSDRVGRKFSLLLGGISLFLAGIVYSLGINFYHFLIAEIIWAFGCAFISGTDSAFLYDTLLELKQERLFKKIWGHSYFLLLIAIAAANIIGGFIGQVNLRWTFIAMLPFFFLLIPLALSLKEPKRKQLLFKKDYFADIVAIIKNSILSNPKLAWLIIYSAIIYAFNQASLWLYQPYFSLTGVDILYFGIIFAAFQIVAAISSKYSYILEKKIGEKYSLILLAVLVGGSYLLMSNFVYLFSFTFAFLQQFVRGFSKVVITDYVNKLTTSDIRATVLSAQSMLGHFLYALIIPFAGWITDVYSLTQALMVLGVTALIAGAIILFIMHHNKVV